MNLGAGLLSAAGPSLDPSGVNFGAGLQRGLLSMQNASQVAAMNAKRNAEREALEREAAQRAKLQEGYNAYVKGLTANVTAGLGGSKALLAMAPEQGFEVILDHMKEQREREGEGPFKGTSMDAQALNKVVAAEKKVARGETLAPDEEFAYSLAKRQLTEPRIGAIHPITGAAVTTPAPPLPAYPGPTTPLPPNAPSAPPSPLPSPGPPIGVAPPMQPMAPEMFGGPAVEEVMGPQFAGGTQVKPDKAGQKMSPEDLVEWGLRPGTSAIYDREGVPKVIQGPPGGEERIERQMKFKAAMNAAERFVELADEHPGLTGALQGRVSERLVQHRLGGSEASAEMYAAQNQMRAMLGTALSGVAIPIQEWPTYEAQLPTMADTTAVRKGKLKQLKIMINDLESQAAQMRGERVDSPTGSPPGFAPPGAAPPAGAAAGWSVEVVK
jgi:hypothetical protein